RDHKRRQWRMGSLSHLDAKAIAAIAAAAAPNAVTQVIEQHVRGITHMPLKIVVAVFAALAASRAGDRDHIVIGKVEEADQPGVASFPFDHFASVPDMF